MFLYTGGTGRLGTEVKKIYKGSNMLFPSSEEFNILNYSECLEFVKNNSITRIIHAAALTDVKESETTPIKAIDINVLGTINIVKICHEQKIKLIFISTDYVFDGKKGNYKSDDPINPLSKYSKSKAAAELVVRMCDNSLVIRTSFFGHNFPYEKAFTDQWTTKDYVDIMAPKILDFCLSDTEGIVHVYSDKDTVFNKAIRRKPTVGRISISSLKEIEIPQDVSLS